MNTYSLEEDYDDGAFCAIVKVMKNFLCLLLLKDVLRCYYCHLVLLKHYKKVPCFDNLQLCFPSSCCCVWELLRFLTLKSQISQKLEASEKNLLQTLRLKVMILFVGGLVEYFDFQM